MRNTNIKTTQSNDSDPWKSFANMRLDEILVETERLLGPGTTPRLLKDSANAQLIDYRRLDHVNDDQRLLMDEWYAMGAHNPDDLAFLAFNSMISLAWPELTCYADIFRSANYESALHSVLRRWSRKLGPELRSSGAILPSWGQLSLERVTSKIPIHSIKQHGLERTACTLLLLPMMEARSHSAAAPLIGLPLALEPLLKSLNKYLLYSDRFQHLSVQSTESAPSWEREAWLQLAAIVLNFSSGIGLSYLPTSPGDEKMARDVQQVTDSQIDFILARELGHIVLGHSDRRASLGDSRGEGALAHESEFEADAFALNLLRSELFNSYRQPVLLHGVGSAAMGAIPRSAFTKYASDLDAICTLHTCMSFLENAGALLRARLKGRFRFHSISDGRPLAGERLDHLLKMNLADTTVPTPVHLSAERLLSGALRYAEGLSDQRLLESVLGGSL